MQVNLAQINLPLADDLLLDGFSMRSRLALPVGDGAQIHRRGFAVLG